MTTLPSLATLPDTHLLVFIGHADDANAEAKAIHDLEKRLQRALYDLDAVTRAARADPPFTAVRCWEWNEDAVAAKGGQATVIDPVLQRADIAVFVFRSRAGVVTWDELTKVREARSRAGYVLALFPADRPDALDEQRRALSQGWTDSGNYALLPVAPYKDIADLQDLAFRQIVRVMHELWQQALLNTSPPPPPPPTARPKASIDISATIEQLANLYTDVLSSGGLLDAIDFPPMYRPAFNDPVSYWRQICRAIQNGRTKGKTVGDLLAAAAQEYPDHPYFQRFHRP